MINECTRISLRNVFFIAFERLLRDQANFVSVNGRPVLCKGLPTKPCFFADAVSEVTDHLEFENRQNGIMKSSTTFLMLVVLTYNQWGLLAPEKRLPVLSVLLEKGRERSK